MNRQAARKEDRIKRKLKEKVDAFRRVNPLAEETHRQGFREGWDRGAKWAYKVCFAAAVISLRELEGYSTKRNIRFLRMMYTKITETLSSEEIIDDALRKAGVQINFDATFDEEAVEEIEGR